MKKLISAVIAAAIMLSTALFISCGKEGGSDNYTFKDGKLVSSDGNKAYFAAPMGFQPYNVGEKCGTRGDMFDLFAIIDPDGNAVSADEWMTEEYAGNASSVYYRDNIYLPSFNEIDYSVCYLCEEDENVVSFATIEDGDLIGALIEKAADGTPDLKRLDDAKERYTVKFHSDDFPAILFSVDLLIYDDAEYLYVISTKQYAEITGMLDEFIGEPGSEG